MIAASVLLPIGPRASPRHLALALESVSRQRGVDAEWVLVLHGEGPAHAEARRFIRGRRRVELVVVDGGVDYAQALEQARQRCRGEVIARMDADDLVHPARLVADLRMLDEDPALGAVASRVRLFPRDHVGAGMRAYIAWQNAAQTPEAIAREIWIEQPLCHPATTFRARALDAVGGYRAGAFPEDYELFLRLHTAGFRLRKRSAVHFGWRMHAGQATRTDGRYARDAFFRVKAEALARHFGLAQRAVIIGGAGKEGGRMARALVACGIAPRAFVDVAPARIGRTRHGCPVHPVEALGALRATFDRAFFIGAVGTSGARPIVRRSLVAAGFVEPVDAVVVA